MTTETYLTLIAYRADGMDSCRGCVMGTSSSDFVIEDFTHIESLAHRYASIKFSEWGHKEDREYCKYEIYVMINGERYNQDDYRIEHPESFQDRIMQEISKQMNISYLTMVRSAEHTDNEKKYAELQRLADLTKKREMEELKRLQEKYA